MAIKVSLADHAFDPAEEYARLAAAVASDGAIASFTGIARSVASDGATVRALLLDHHPRLTLASVEDIASDAGARFGVSMIRLVHRCGKVAAGEAIVFVAAAAPHRRAALEAVDYMMDCLKSEAMFWKKEITDDGGQWIEPTDQDRAALARWDRDDGGN